MSHTALVYSDPVELRWQDYLGDRDVITWAPLKFADSDYAYVEVFSQDSFWAPDSKTYPAVTVGDVETNFIRKVFRELDKLLEPEFIETSPEDADIILMGLLPEKGKETWRGGGHASARTPYPGMTERGAKFGYVSQYEATGKNNLDQWEMGTILHEIGHLMHLDHPLGDGYSESFDESISVMSYNDDSRFGGAEPIWYRELDIHTMQDAWGEETNAEAPEWPATESFPAVIDHLPYSDPVVDPLIVDRQGSASSLSGNQGEENQIVPAGAGKDVEETIESASAVLQSSISGEATAEEFKLIKERKVEKTMLEISTKIQSKWEARQISKKIGGDNEMDVYIHIQGGKIGNKRVRKVGKAVAASQVEVDFMIDVLNDIDKVSGLNFNLVTTASDADIVIAPMKMKKWEYWFDEPRKKAGPWTYSWLSDGKEGMTINEKNFCTQVMLGAIGLRELSSKDRKKYSSFHTIMSWNDLEYYGFTTADNHAISSLWGEP